MDVTVTIKDEANGRVVHEGSYQLYDVLLLMMKRGENGKPVIEDYEPLEINNHPDTLREIGGRIACFVEQTA